MIHSVTGCWFDEMSIQRENAELLARVRTFAKRYPKQHNLFGAKFWLHDFLVDMHLYILEDIYDREVQHKSKLGAGAYCNVAKCRAINYAQAYSADKRKANFYTVSLDDISEPAQFRVTNQLDIFLADARLSLSEEQFNLLKEALVSKLSRSALRKLKTKEVYEFLTAAAT